MHSDHILKTAADWQSAGARVALAVVVATWGSSPRQAGSIMAMSDDGKIAGSVSGGCVEGTVIGTARDLLESGGTSKLDFGVADETAWQVGLPCGGEISVFICPDSAIEDGLLASAAAAIAKRQAVVINCHLTGDDGMAGAKEKDKATANTITGDIFHLAIPPAPRLIIIGAGHISQHLAGMAAASDFAVTVIDPREAFTAKDRFPTAEVITDWPDTVLGGMVLDGATAVVTLTHDAKIDDAALLACLNEPVFYIASLGSTRSHAKRTERLLEAGMDKPAIGRIHAPAGLDIGAATPPEIAASILAQMIAVMRGKK